VYIGRGSHGGLGKCLGLFFELEDDRFRSFKRHRNVYIGKGSGLGLEDDGFCSFERHRNVYIGDSGRLFFELKDGASGLRSFQRHRSACRSRRGVHVVGSSGLWLFFERRRRSNLKSKFQIK
jgi:hypothetical protein